MDPIRPGMPVYHQNTLIGVVHVLEDDPSAHAPTVVVQHSNGVLARLTPDHYTSSEDGIYIDAGESDLQSQAPPDRAPIRTSSESSPPAIMSEPNPSETDLARGPSTTLGIEPGDQLTIPVIREEPVVEKREVERGGVRIHKRVTERPQHIQQELLRDEVDVSRVPIGRVVETAPPVRREGATLIIPVLEEQLVVEKRLVLKEELHVTRRRHRTNEQTEVTLREEEVEIERIRGDDRV